MSNSCREKKLVIWDAFCREHHVLESSVPLFATDGVAVAVRPLGIRGRSVLARSPEMEALVIAETNKVLADYASGAGEYEGLIYMMLWPEGGRALPLYVGKSEKYGRGGGNLSANIASIERNRHKFCRWGDGYAYHIGDLSAVACPGHPPEVVNAKYRRWADRLFESWPTAELRLRPGHAFLDEGVEEGLRGAVEGVRSDVADLP